MKVDLGKSFNQTKIKENKYSNEHVLSVRIVKEYCLEVFTIVVVVL